MHLGAIAHLCSSASRRTSLYVIHAISLPTNFVFCSILACLIHLLTALCEISKYNATSLMEHNSSISCSIALISPCISVSSSNFGENLHLCCSAIRRTSSCAIYARFLSVTISFFSIWSCLIHFFMLTTETPSSDAVLAKE